MTQSDRLERLTNLVLVLLDARTPLSLDAIVHQVPGYPTDHETRRQAFERDKRLLRDEGIAVSSEPIAGASQVGYRIEPDSFYLPDPGLTADEQAAVHLAVAGVHLGDPSGRDALMKLGTTGLAETWTLASMVPPPALVSLFEAVRRRAVVGFDYRGHPRRVAPAAVWFRRGRWYLVGWDSEREAPRTFRVDRFDGAAECGEPESAVLPPGFDAEAALPDEPWRIGTDDEEEQVSVRIDAVEGPRVAREVAGSGEVRVAEDGSVVVVLAVTNRAALRSWVLGLLDHAEVLEPPAVRRVVTDWLHAMVEAPVDVPVDVPVGAPVDVALEAPAPGDAEPAGTERVAATRVSERLRRLLAIVGWLARVGEAPLVDVAARFGLTEEELTTELELAACCGLPPYTPDVLMEIEVTDTSVRTFLPPELGRARRLTPSEGFALAAAARTILAVPGADQDGALASALSKLDAALGDHGGLVVELEQPEPLAAVRAAAAERTRLEIEYYSASSDEVSTRTVDPIRVVTLDGHWYLDAACLRAGDVRRFRVDRIRSVRVTGPQPPPPSSVTSSAATDDPGEHRAFVAGPGARRVRLALTAEAAWLIDTVPVVERVEMGDGLAELVLEVGGLAWLERLLLQLGTAARVLEPAEWQRAAPDAAQRVLDRYAAGA